MSGYEILAIGAGAFAGFVLGLEFVLGGVLPRRYVEKYKEVRDLSEHLARRMGRPWQARIQQLFDNDAEPLDPLIRKYLAVYREYRLLRLKMGKEDLRRFEQLEEEDLAPEALARLPIDLDLFQRASVLRREMDRLGEKIFEKLKRPWEASEVYRLHPSQIAEVANEVAAELGAWKSETVGRLEKIGKILTRGRNRSRSRRSNPGPHPRSSPRPSPSPSPRPRSRSDDRPTQSKETRTPHRSWSPPPPASSGPKWDGAPHEVLGISRDADTGQIDVAYRRLIRRYHPDVAVRRFNLSPEEAHRYASILNRSKKEMLQGRRQNVA